MKLSIVILNYKSKNLVKGQLKKILTFKFSWPWEIIVVDNNSQDGIGQIIKKYFPVVKFLQFKKNIGMGAGNNAGIKASSGEYILIANPDIFITEDAVKTMVSFMDRNKKTGVIGPSILNPDKTPQESCWRFPKFITFIYRRTFLGNTSIGRSHLKSHSYYDLSHNDNIEVDWVLGGCMLIRRQTLKEIGMFDSRFFLFLEDTDLCRRATLAGWQVWYLGRAKVIHLPHRLSASRGFIIKYLFSKIVWIHICSWIKYFWKWRRFSQ